MKPPTNYIKPGRASVKVRVRHVEDQACAGREDGGEHVLRNREMATRCVWCGETWAALDEALNGRLGTRGGL